ncbi:MAG: SusC/RagA family TonB-linked outer membrane protein [Saprospiraceae bacterium]|nr:SusC/RagA family TonB-linked outer membrane protein [Saprospiraceae bacterium]
MRHFFKQTVLVLLAICAMSTAALAQFTAKGSVQDANGEALIGVSIILKGTTSGTATDLDGNFELPIQEGSSAMLMLSYTGYKTVEVEVTQANSTVTVTMEEDFAKLDEVVVTGLASGVKRSNSGISVATVSGDELTENTTAQTLDNALYGKVPGVLMQSNSGAPGGGINMQLRGISTLGAGSSQPLYIVDGVYVDNSTIRTGRTQVNGASGGASAATQDDGANRIADLNPDDIANIEVLKGPSAAAIYGTRANAGVIIITTKKGQAGRTKVSLSQDIGFAKGQNFVGFDDWDEAKINSFFGATAAGPQLDALRAAQNEGRVTDWEEYFYGETPLLSNTNLRVSGGNQKTQFYVSGGVQSEDGIIQNTGFDRYSIRANIDHKLNDFIRLSLNSNYVNSKSDRGFTGNQNNTGGSLGYNIAYTPTYANLFPDEAGNYPDNPYFNDNPVAIRDLGVNQQNVDRFITAFNLDIDLLQNSNSFLKFKVNGGVDYLSGNSQVYFPEILQHQRAQANPGDVMWGRQDIFNTNLQAFLTYNTTIGGNIVSNTTVGGVRLDQDSEFLLARGRGLLLGQNNLEWAQVVSTQEQTNQTVTDLGWVAQQDFNWDDKLIASLGVRFDRSTLNRDQQKYYAFPKASLAANLSNFDFWNIDAISQFKLRAAYGETGGLPVFGQTFESLNSQLIGGNIGSVVSARSIDPNLEPETASELEFGVDMALFDNRVTFEASFYNKEVRDLILDLTPAGSVGVGAIATNAADLTNKGIELALGFTPIRTDKIDWYSKVMWWTNESEITRLDIPTRTVGGFGNSLGTYLIAEGYSPTTIVGNPAGTNIPGGLTVYGDRQPDFTLTWFNQVNFLKNFDLNFLFHYQNGGEAINLSALLWDLGGTTPGWDEDPDGDGIGKGTSRVIEWSGGNTGVYIQPTDYIKLRELGLYYTFPQALLPSLVERLKIGVSVNNMLLWTDYGSYDPEVSNFGAQPISGNIEVTPFPSSRRFFFHVKMDF